MISVQPQDPGEFILTQTNGFDSFRVNIIRASEMATVDLGNHRSKYAELSTGRLLPKGEKRTIVVLGARSIKFGIAVTPVLLAEQVRAALSVLGRTWPAKWVLPLYENSILIDQDLWNLREITDRSLVQVEWVGRALDNTTYLALESHLWAGRVVVSLKSLMALGEWISQLGAGAGFRPTTAPFSSFAIRVFVDPQDQKADWNRTAALVRAMPWMPARTHVIITTNAATAGAMFTIASQVIRYERAAQAFADAGYRTMIRPVSVHEHLHNFAIEVPLTEVGCLS